MANTYYWTRQFSMTRMTCGELVAVLERTGGNIWCMGGRYFVENEGEKPAAIDSAWDWIQSQRHNKKLLVLSLDSEEGVIVES